MRIAYVTETFPPEINGVSLTAERTLAHLRAAGHQVQLIRPRQRGEARLDSADEWRSAGGPIPMYPELRYGLARSAALRRRWARGTAGAPDLVHATTPGPLAFAALRAARAEGIATSADFRTNFHSYSRHYGFGWLEPWVLGYLRRLHALADTSFVPTHALATQLAGQGFERLQVVGRGVDADRFSPVWRDDWLRRDWHARSDNPVLLYVGRLAAEKNVELALSTFETLRRSRRGLRMVVVGDGPLRDRLRASHRRVRFVGVQRGLALSRCYASADVFLFPSLTETFGNVTLEAAASGLAVVAFDAAAAARHLQHGVSGWLAAPSAGTAGRLDFVEMAGRALEDWRPGSAVRQRAREASLRADWDTVLRGFEQRLRGVAAQSAGSTRHAALA